jgi:hypothetical protein
VDVIFLSGCVRDDLPPSVGLMLTPMMGNRLPDDRVWGADTGMFAAPHKHDRAKYLGWLDDRGEHAHRCLFATAEDVVGDAEATLDLAVPMLEVIRSIGFKAALVAQDGLEELAVPWDEFDCLFVGGTTGWKLSEAAYELVREAKARGKWCHMGRVNSFRRLSAARTAGYDSADGTYVAFGPDINGPKLSRWLTALERQPSLPLEQSA